LKESLRILPSKEVKFFRKYIKEQWGADFKEDLAFLMSAKDRIYVANKDVGKIDLSKLRINTIGFYFGEYRKEKLRLSIEGSQLIGPLAKKNVVELKDDQVLPWLRGENVFFDGNGEDFVLIKHNDDFIGSGRVSDLVIFNFVPKARRLMVSDLP
jgi:NOL1/NOP2/fmu family ribosome biogenesis protein